MSEKNNGGPAFPVSTACNDGHLGHQDGPSTWQFPGMTLRDYFAAKFMGRAQSLCEDRGEWNMQTAAQCAYVMADAMLEARKS